MTAMSLPVRLDARALLPREHGLWAWLGVPLVTALILQPTAGTALAGGTVLAGFGAINALARMARGSSDAGRMVAPAVVVAGVALVGAIATAAHPVAVAVPLIAIGVGGFAATLAVRGKFAVNPSGELTVIAGLAALGGVIAAANGAAVRDAIAVTAVVASWHAVGLWWVNRQLAPVLPTRTAWRSGAWIVGAFAAIGAGTAAIAAGPACALLIALYPVRMFAHERLVDVRDARRVGMTEFVWSLSIGAAAALLTRVV